MPTVSINLVSILGERHWRAALQRYWPIPAFTIVGSFVGTHWLLSVDPEPLRLLLALVLIAYLVSDHLHRGERPIRVGRWGQALFGLVLGLLAWLIWGGDEIYDDERPDPDVPARLHARGYRLAFAGEDLQACSVWCDNGGAEGFNAFIRTIRHYRDQDAFLFPGTG